MSYNLSNRRAYRKPRISGEGFFFGLFASIWVTVFIGWLVVKIPAVIILIVNIGYLITAHNNGTLGSFDPFWLILSAAATILL